MSTTKRHILLIPSWYSAPATPSWGTFFKDQAVALQKAGMKAGVVYPELRSLLRVHPRTMFSNRFQKTYAEEDGIPTVRLHGWSLFPFFGVRPAWWVHLVGELFDDYVRHFGKPDLIHAHGALWAGVAAAKISATSGIPWVLTEHFSGYARGLVTGRAARQSRAVFAAAPRLIVVSRFLGKCLEEGGWTVAGRAEIVPNLVDGNFFTLPARGARPGGSRLLAAGSLVPIKNFGLLLRVMAGIAGSKPEVQLEIAGEGPDRRSLERLARQLGVQDRVKFLGPLRREEVREAYWRSHLLVHASNFETFGVVLAEAMATGLPVVATRCGGPEEVVTPATGMLVQVNNVEAFSRAVLQTLDCLEKYSAEAIRKESLDRFGSVRVASQLEQIYEMVLQAHGRPKMEART